MTCVGVIAARAGDNRDAAARLFDGDFNDAQMFGMGKRGAFAGGAAGDKEIDAGGDLPIDNARAWRLRRASRLV